MTPRERWVGEEGRPVEEWLAGGWQQVGKREEAAAEAEVAMEKEMRRQQQQGLEAGNPPAVPLAEVVVRGGTGEGAGNGKERRMRQGMAERMVVQESLALVESQEEELKNRKKKLKGSHSTNFLTV